MDQLSFAVTFWYLWCLSSHLGFLVNQALELWKKRRAMEEKKKREKLTVSHTLFNNSTNIYSSEECNISFGHKISFLEIPFLKVKTLSK